MTSEMKLLANRSNAKKSTGPKTERGKARSRFNAMKTGLHANHRPLPAEDHKAYQKLSRRLVKLYGPQDPVEEIIVDQILGAIWRVGRLERAEKAYLLAIDRTRRNRQGQFDLSLKVVVTGDKVFNYSPSKITPLPNEKFCQAEIIDGLDDTFLEAAINRAEKEPLRYLRKQRSAHLDELLCLEDEFNRRRRDLVNRFSLKTCGNRNGQKPDK